MSWSRDRAGSVQAALSHETALHAYGLSDVMPAETHLTVPKGFRKRPPSGVRLHRHALLATDVSERDGYRITTPLRTLLDVAASGLSAEHLVAAARAALDQGLVRKRLLEAAIAEAPDGVKARIAGIGLP